MSGILSTDGVSTLSRYMAAMTVAMASTAASLPDNGSENEQRIELSAPIDTTALKQLLWTDTKPNSNGDTK